MELLPAARLASEQFPLRVTLSYLSRMEKGNRDDPLLKQVLPLSAELEIHAGFGTDPVGDLAASPLPGLLHKYQGRVLLMTTGACAIHCRYCFRRHYPYTEGCASPNRFESVLDYIRADASIEEVILSGGDPLSLSNERLLGLLFRLSEISHLKRLRLHTRLPVVLPERIDTSLLAGLARLPQALVMVLHSNHPNEIDASVIAALRGLSDIDVNLLNQAVLLKGINDDVPSLKRLGEQLFAAGVLPYYLHQLDRVQGAHHFEVARPAALALIDALSQQLPGYLVPKLVEEVPGAAAKTLLAY